jgi:predicted phage terminase large subunit-like protein
MPNRIKYHNNLEKAYKLSGRTDLESFIIYYEWEEKDKFYEPRYEVLSGYCYYLNKMVFDPEFEGIVANLPSGWGKTYLTALASAFSYGVDDTGTILALCSNEDVVNGGSRTVKEIMQSDRYGDVFPNLKWNKEDKSYYSKDTESEWKLKDCKLSASYYARTTKSNVVGVRASKWVHIDDLYADYKEALNENDNIYYFNKFLTVWRKRFIQEAPIWKYIITGTMWSPKDFIVKIISWLEKRYKFVKHPKFKYVKVSDNGKFAIIQVPALNMKTGKSNCEALASTKTLLNEKASMDSYIFECNFQQNPVSPESMAFDWKNLKTYNTRLKNEYGATYSVIDGTRKSGKDFFSMPILQPYNGDYALIDCIYTQAATSKLYGAIVDKIITHNIKILVIETNVDGGLKTVIEKELKERGFNNGIQIIEKYSTVIKQTRIELEKGNIVDRIYYPDMSMLALNSDMGKFMTSFTMYNIEGNNVHDDANDSLGMFTSEIVAGKSKPQKARPIKRPF